MCKSGVRPSHFSTAIKMEFQTCIKENGKLSGIRKNLNMGVAQVQLLNEVYISGVKTHTCRFPRGKMICIQSEDT